MGNISVEPYLFFNGNCREAMEFYKSIFGDEIKVMTYDDVPGPTQKGMAGKLMHASLVDGEVNLMASDSAKASDKMAKASISLAGTDEEKLTKIFDRLSEGVEVQYPLKKESWGDILGSVTDKFGIDWMVNIGA